MNNKLIAAAALTVLLTACGQSEPGTPSAPKRTSYDVPPATIAAALPLNDPAPQQTSPAGEQEIITETSAVTEASVTTAEAAGTTSAAAAHDLELEQLAEPQTEAVAEGAQEETASADPQYDTFLGVLIDEDCSDFEDPPSHDLPCMLMDECRASGYGLDIQQEDGSWIFYMFDENGQELTWGYLRQTSRMDGLYVTVTGIWEDNVIKVIEISEY